MTATNLAAIYDIKRIVADEFGIGVELLAGRKRYPYIVIPRMVAMYFARIYGMGCTPKISLQPLADIFGAKDHGTIIHACKATESRREVDIKFRTKTNVIAMKIAKALR